MNDLIMDGIGMQGDVNWLIFGALIILGLFLTWITSNSDDE